jgi:hypothetical protein
MVLVEAVALAAQEQALHQDNLVQAVLELTHIHHGHQQLELVLVDSLRVEEAAEGTLMDQLLLELVAQAEEGLLQLTLLETTLL